MADTLDFCDCCEGVVQATPAPVVNRPGLSALAYRIGTHGRFREAMQTAIGQQRPLDDLTTRAEDDPTLALVDAWATVLDVLTFYQERIANEGFLRTAVERRSVLELARRIGYELRPGVAAATYLAFTLQDAPGAPAIVTVPEGTRAQSLPGQDESPQTFETVAPIEARPVWQGLGARPREPAIIARGTPDLWLEGVDNNLAPGDGLLLVGERRLGDSGSERWDFRRIDEVDRDRDRNITRVVLERGLGSYVPFTRPAEDPAVYVFRQRAALFGANAPDWDAMPEEVRTRYDQHATNGSTFSDWPGLTISEVADGRADTVHLDAAYPKIVAGSWVVLQKPGWVELYGVTRVDESSRSGFALSGKSTRLELEGEHLETQFDDAVRETVVYAVSEQLERAEVPIDRPVEGTTVVLAERVEGLAEEQLVALAGTDVDTGEMAAEVATIEELDEVDGLTRLTLAAELGHRYAREDADGVTGVRLNANVAPATHGETVAEEVLGSGDGAKTFQSFTLAHSPLTHVSAGTPSGTASTLEVRVDGVRWEEVPSLYGQPSDAHVYTTRIGDDGTVTVRFGDGRAGARLPTGTENVTARYRHGLGLDGLVDAGQISLLMTRPLGVREAANPAAPTGADDPESLNGARGNAPLTVLTLDRIVSVQDFEDFAAAFAGIGKARASVLWSGERRLVHLTVAGAAGAPVPEGSALYTSLRDAVDGARDANEAVIIDSYHGLTFGLEARVFVDPVYMADEVTAAVEAALRDAFSFEARAFGQGVTTADVLATMQAVDGVVAVDLERLDGHDPFQHPRLAARSARWEDGAVEPAELLTIDPGGITLTPTAP